MKLKIYFFIFITIVSVFAHFVYSEQPNIYFDIEDIPLLKLDKFNDFWEDSETVKTSEYMGANFEDHSGFIGGKRFASESKSIGISIFKSKEMAIIVMEERIMNAASIIVHGEKQKHFVGKWWYTEGIPKRCCC